MLQMNDAGILGIGGVRVAADADWKIQIDFRKKTSGTNGAAEF